MKRLMMALTIALVLASAAIPLTQSGVVARASRYSILVFPFFLQTTPSGLGPEDVLYAGVNITFVAPEGGKYYLVIANINSPGFIQVTVEYGRANNWPIIATGVAVGIMAILLVVVDLRRVKREVPLDSRCPACGAQVNSSWKFCPHCRNELGGGGK